jgi:hypothetical protein
MLGGQWKVPMFDGLWKVSMFGGQWKVPMFDGLWKVSMFGGQWKVPMFDGPWKISMFGGQWKEKEKHLFTFSHFPPNKFYLNLHFFALISRFYFIMVLGLYTFPSFSYTYKL